MKNYTPEEIMKAHQICYYVASSPIWGDFEYDRFCELNGLNGNGGSDVLAHYDARVIVLADDMVKHPEKYPVPREVYQ